MLSSTDLLHVCVEALRRFTGAKRVSLYLPAEPGVSRHATLIHDGDVPAVPELADLEAARELVERVARTDGDAADARFMRQLVSAAADGRLIRISSPESLPALLLEVTPRDELPPARRHTDVTGADTHADAALWLGLAAESGSAADPPWRRLEKDESWLPALASALAWHQREMADLLLDPISGLFGRGHFQALLREATERARRDEAPLTLLLINPDDFAVVNETFGSEAGDAVIREIAQRLQVTMRSKDLLARYGGAIFAVGLQGVGSKVGEVVAEKAHKKLTEGPYRRGSVRLGFSTGLVAYEPTADDDPEESALELLRRADRTLNLAKEAGGGRVAVWRREIEPRSTGSVDRLTGIFTANLAKDYRNMLVLWETVIVVSKTGDFEALAAKLVERLHASFRADRVGLFGWSDDGEPRLIKGKVRTEGEEPEPLELDAEQRGLLDAARTQGLAGKPALVFSESESKRICCVPLIAREQCLGGLYIDGRRDAVTFDRSDSIFFKALAGQLAVTLDRTRLADQERTHQKHERQRLRSELKELRRALQEARLVYSSAEMESILATLRRVAPTDETLLITGESGTGKELFARTAHELSQRSRKALVIVDCGAIAESLIDRELFGHEKGAYTGAEKPAAGRLAEADGGTLLLDEIGELPLEVQSKLLRFTQEKMLTPVGGTRSRRVDVRIIAVTNRDLASEVEAGRFRADLYYRLNVLHLEVPPLRQRPDDILFLARHFLEKFSLQYQKAVQRLSPGAEASLLRYSWPGNVRELQNRVMQAVLMSEADEIGPGELKLDFSGPAAAFDKTPAIPASTARPPVAAGDAHPGEPVRRELRETPDEAWDALGPALGFQVESALRTATLAPLGRWLAEDLILEAGAGAGGVLARGAELLGMPESTFRRRFRRARAAAGFQQRSPGWETVRPLVAGLLRSHVAPEGRPGSEVTGEDLLERARGVLLEEIAGRIPSRGTATGAALMGVSEPTFRRLMSSRSPDG